MQQKFSSYLLLLAIAVIISVPGLRFLHVSHSLGDAARCLQHASLEAPDDLSTEKMSAGVKSRSVGDIDGWVVWLDLFE